VLAAVATLGLSYQRAVLSCCALHAVYKYIAEAPTASMNLENNRWRVAKATITVFTNLLAHANISENGNATCDKNANTSRNTGECNTDGWDHCFNVACFAEQFSVVRYLTRTLVAAVSKGPEAPKTLIKHVVALLFVFLTLNNTNLSRVLQKKVMVTLNTLSSLDYNSDFFNVTDVTLISAAGGENDCSNSNGEGSASLGDADPEAGDCGGDSDFDALLMGQRGRRWKAIDCADPKHDANGNYIGGYDCVFKFHLYTDDDVNALDQFLDAGGLDALARIKLTPNIGDRRLTARDISVVRYSSSTGFEQYRNLCKFLAECGEVVNK